jgi:hypothetical protein
LWRESEKKKVVFNISRDKVDITAATIVWRKNFCDYLSFFLGKKSDEDVLAD